VAEHTDLEMMYDVWDFLHEDILFQIEGKASAKKIVKEIKLFIQRLPEVRKAHFICYGAKKSMHSFHFIHSSFFFLS